MRVGRQIGYMTLLVSGVHCSDRKGSRSDFCVLISGRWKFLVRDFIYVE